MYRDWKLDADEVVALPLDELALLVLRDAHDNEELNWGNWLNDAKRAYSDRLDALQALGEAWGWLQSHGLISWNPSQSHERAFVVSRKGQQVLQDGMPWLRAVERLDISLVPELERTARPQFLRGDFETAAFAAMKEVEVQVRAKAGLGNDLFGTALMQKAFRPPKNETDTGGPLYRAVLEAGESLAQMYLFMGAIGLFKNPTSHRRVDLSDPTEAAEIVLLADLLLRLLRKIELPSADEG
ncbi:TIGR02391 family protein [Allorhizocola rhizosphaerae]|uniref:TIGR02391 family protein n=1 Tax=Allorhizocola rhizosphaerae TaxID=1872709 RepID=UPI000E3D5DC2|nr:TIGR02391 family protein [Allorhizocola rhizosphaerae]